MRVRTALVLVLGFLGPSCQEDLGLDAQVSDGGALSDGGIEQTDAQEPLVVPGTGHQLGSITWASCPSFISNEVWLSHVGEVRPNSCGKLDVPLNWEQVNGRQISLFYQRIEAKEPVKGQIWLVNGGPGSDGLALIELPGLLLAARFPDHHIIVMDHRGTGDSNWLGCEDELSSDFPGGVCQSRLTEEWTNEGLQKFNVTQAALDLGHSIEALRVDGGAVTICGTSYGTYLIQRYLHFFPEQAQAVVLDSICPPSGCEFVTWDQNQDQIGRDLLKLCSLDPLCQNKLGLNPEATTQELYQKLDQRQHCPGLLTETSTPSLTFKQTLSRLIEDQQFRVLIPALIYRAHRCDFQDQQALQSSGLFGFRPTYGQNSEKSFSSYLLYLISFSEFWQNPLTLEEAEAQDLAALFTDRITPRNIAIKERWFLPEYPQDPWQGHWPQRKGPILALNGTLDPQTSHHSLGFLKSKLTEKGQYYLEISGANHIVLGYQRDRWSCVQDLFSAFIEAPLMPLDSSCLEQTPAIDFQNRNLAQTFFASDDLFENPPPGLRKARMRLNAQQQKLKAELGAVLTDVNRTF